MKLYRAEVWKVSESPHIRCYCSDWLDDRQDARSLSLDALHELRECEPESRFQGLIRVSEEVDG